MKSAETIGNDGIQLLIAVYEQQTIPKWLPQIPAIEILRQTWAGLTQLAQMAGRAQPCHAAI